MCSHFSIRRLLSLYSDTFWVSLFLYMLIPTHVSSCSFFKYIYWYIFIFILNSIRIYFGVFFKTKISTFHFVLGVSYLLFFSRRKFNRRWNQSLEIGLKYMVIFVLPVAHSVISYTWIGLHATSQMLILIPQKQRGNKIRLRFLIYIFKSHICFFLIR